MMNEALRQRLQIFQESTGTRKLVNWVFLSAFGLKPNAHSLGIVSQALDLGALYE